MLKLFRANASETAGDLYAEFLPFSIGLGQVASFDIGREVYDLGTPDRLLRFGRV